MQYNQPYGVSDPNAPYINGNPSTGTQGSIPPAASIEYPQREIANLIADGGFTPSNGDLRQMGRSLQSGHIWYGVDTGVKNALQANLSPAPLTYYDGMFVWIVANNTNDGPCTLQLNGLPATVIQRRGGGDVIAGDIPAGYKSLFCYSVLHSNFELYGINFTGGETNFLPVLTQNTTLYVNGSTGSDTLYDGTSATVVGPGSPKAGPFKTIARAMNKTFTYGPSVYTMTISIAAGTYNEAVKTPNFAGPQTILDGGSATTTFVTGANNTHTIQSLSGNTMIVRNITTSTGTGTGPPCHFSVSASGNMQTVNCRSQGACPGYVWNAYGTSTLMASTHTFVAGSSVASCMVAAQGGFLPLSQSAVYTFAGAFTINAGGAFAVATANGSIQVPSLNVPTFVNPGNVTGTKWIATLNGVVNSQGAGTGYFPGSVAGSASTGGQYG
jgi:hypothetical protein